MTDPAVTVYLAEPIDQAQQSKRGPITPWGRLLSLTASILNSLEAGGYNVYRPRAAWRAPKLDRRVEKVNRVALNCADVIVAVLPAGVPTIGVPAEIAYATMVRGIPAVVLHDGASQSLISNPMVEVVQHPSDLLRAVARAATERNPMQRLLAAIEEADEPTRVVVSEGWPAPGRAYSDDAGIDLAVTETTILPPGGYADLPTQVEHTQLPEGYWGLITGRSSMIRKLRLHVPNGVIDPGWRGPLYVGALNLGTEAVTVTAGARIGQLILIPNAPAPVQVVDKVDEHPRGLNGFGSSGA